RFSGGSVEAATLLEWVTAGTRDDATAAPRLTGLRVFPAERIAAAPSLTQQLVVTAGFADGSIRDVTRAASFDVSDPTHVRVSADGRVEMQGPGETTVAVRYLDGR